MIRDYDDPRLSIQEELYVFDLSYVFRLFNKFPMLDGVRYRDVDINKYCLMGPFTVLENFRLQSDDAKILLKNDSYFWSRRGSPVEIFDVTQEWPELKIPLADFNGKIETIDVICDMIIHRESMEIRPTRDFTFKSPISPSLWFDDRGFVCSKISGEEVLFRADEMSLLRARVRGKTSHTIDGMR